MPILVQLAFLAGDAPIIPNRSVSGVLLTRPSDDDVLELKDDLLVARENVIAESVGDTQCQNAEEAFVDPRIRPASAAMPPSATEPTG